MPGIPCRWCRPSLNNKWRSRIGLRDDVGVVLCFTRSEGLPSVRQPEALLLLVIATDTRQNALSGQTGKKAISGGRDKTGFNVKTLCPPNPTPAPVIPNEYEGAHRLGR
ncbi:MAG: hypothetical protein U5K72_14365 [Balneolaceae bacterium]|nr:hypothetical protein [Balneolaceae bacterium]